MGKAKTASYIIEVELYPEEYQKHRLKKKFKVARAMYNTFLKEALKRHRKVKRNKEYQELLKNKDTPNRNKRLNEIRKEYGFCEYSLHEYAVDAKHHFEGHLGINEVQKLATRAFEAVEKIHYGKAKRVHFKRASDSISVENKKNNTGLRFQDGNIVWGTKPSKKNPNPKNWIDLPIETREIDEYNAFALMDRTKYVRLLEKEIRGKMRYFAHLIQEGIPPSKEDRKVANNSNRIGLDIGPSTVAVVSDEEVSFRELAPEITDKSKELRRLERAMDRSRRVNNPQNFDESGKAIRGRKQWCNSRRYNKLRAKRKNICRQMAAIRNESHEKLANNILSLGSDVRVEEMSFKGLTRRSKATTYNKSNGKINTKKRYGKAISRRAPGTFLAILDRKLGYQGRQLKKIKTSKVKASQINHVTGEYKKKDISERWNDVGERRVQRDLYSAFIIQNTTEKLDTVDIKACDMKWENFLELHDMEIARLRALENKALNWYIG